MDLDIRDSTPDWAPYLAPKAPEGAPNVVFIVWDDVGYGTMDCFGGPVRTPTMSRIANMGVKYGNQIFAIEDLARGDVMFAATGVTDGFLLRGVRFTGTGAETHSVVMRSRSGTVRFIRVRHHFNRNPDYDGRRRPPR